jgi:hypothetical protein
MGTDSWCNVTSQDAESQDTATRAETALTDPNHGREARIYTPLDQIMLMS